MYVSTQLTYVPKYCPETVAETLMHVSLFYKLCHPIPHGPNFNTKRSVTLAH